MSLMSKTERDLDLLILEDLEFQTPCAGKLHGDGVKGHQPDQAATHYIKCPECHKVSLVCAGRATYVRSTPNATMVCYGNSHTYPFSEWEVGRIPGK